MIGPFVPPPAGHHHATSSNNNNRKQSKQKGEDRGYQNVLLLPSVFVLSDALVATGRTSSDFDMKSMPPDGIGFGAREAIQNDPLNFTAGDDASKNIGYARLFTFSAHAGRAFNRHGAALRIVCSHLLISILISAYHNSLCRSPTTPRPFFPKERLPARCKLLWQKRERCNTSLHVRL